MKKPHKPTENGAPQATTLRQQAEETLLQRHIDRKPVSSQDAQRLLHELEVHQIELEMQNEELLRGQVELEALRARYFDLYDLAPVGYFTLSEKGIFLEVNLTACSLLGINRSDLVRQPLSRFILAEDADIYYMNRKKIFATSEAQACEIRMLRQDGAMFWVRMVTTASLDSEGAPVCRVVISDISSRKQDEEALKESRDYFFSLFDNAPLGYQSLDEQGRFIHVNQVWLETLGYERDEVIGKWFGDFLAPEFVEPFRTRFPIFKAKGQIHSEFQMLQKSGSRRILSFDGRISYQQDGSFKQTHCILADITLRKEFEENLRQSEEKYRTLFEGMSQGAFYQAADGRLTDVNPAALRMFGLTRQEFLERTSLTPAWSVIRDDGGLLPGDEHPSMAALRTGLPVKDMTVGILNPSTNEYTWTIVNAIPQFRPGESSPFQVYVTLHDITRSRQVENQLKAFANRQEALLAAIPDVLMEVDVNKVYTWANKAGIEFFGDDVVGREAAFYFEGEQETYDSVRNIFHGNEETVYVESWQCRCDGQKRLLAWWCHVLKDADGNTIGALSSAHDITERSQAEEALKQSEYRQKAILNNIPDIAWIKDLQGKYIIVNEAFAQSAGYDTETIVGKTDRDLWHQDLAAKYQADDLHVMQSRQRIVFEEQLVSHDGTVTLMESIKTPMYGDTGDIIGTIGISRNITERVTMTEMLRLSSQKWRDTFDAIIDPVSLLSLDGTINQCNRAFLKCLRLDFEDVLGRQCSQLIHGTDERIEGCPTVKVLESGQRETIELQFGEKFFIVMVDPVKEPDGKICAFVHIMRDITILKLAELDLQAKNAELERFTYSVSHDLRSPLVTIRTFMGHLAEDIALGDTGHVEQDMGFIDNASQKMVELLDELLQLSRIGRMFNPAVEAPLQDIVQEALALVAGSIDERGVRVTVTQKPVMFYGDRVRLVEVFQNLVDNGVKFMGEQAEPLIEIGAESRLTDIVCFVRDNGMGIDPRHKDKLFGLFEKLNSDIEGSGLGLALVERIIETHGGRIWAESEGLGKGACFYFTLPRKSSES